MNVLVVEDDAKISRYIQRGLLDAGHTAEFAANGLAGLNLASARPFDLCIIDLMVPEIDGISLIQKIRAQKIETPILILSGERSIEDCVAGLKNGGDDFLTKPFSVTELLARSQTLLRRRNRFLEEQQSAVGPITLNLVNRQAFREGGLVELQSREFALLELLMNPPGRVITKTQILEHVWNYNFDPQTNVVDVLVCRLRNKIDKPFAIKTIYTVRGVGYVFRIGHA
jgi:two-component system, OmpR family, response regulator